MHTPNVSSDTGGSKQGGRRSPAPPQPPHRQSHLLGGLHTLHLQSHLPEGSKISTQTKSCQLKPKAEIHSPTHFFCFPCHSVRFILARSHPKSYHSIFPLPTRKENKVKKMMLRRYPHAAGAVGETPATEAEMRCLPWTEPVGIA